MHRARAPWRVVLMVRALHLGGTERQLTELAISLDRALFAPTVACFDARGIRADDLRRAGVPIVEFPVRSFASAAGVREAWQFARWLRRLRIALVHAFDVPTVLFAVPVARLARVPVVLSSQRGDRRLFSFFDQRALSVADHLADGIVVNSTYIREVLAGTYGVPEDRMYTCPNGLDTRMFHPNGRSPASAGAATIGIVAALRSEKSLETLLTAFAALQDQQHRLVIVGDGPCKPSLESLARELGIQGRCLFEPATPDVASWYRRLDVFVLPSINESFSNSLMEAMACGCCVIASNVGGNPELIRHEINGLLFECGNADDLASKLSRVLADPTFRARLAARALSTIHAGYTNEVASKHLEAFYRQKLRSAAD